MEVSWRVRKFRLSWWFFVPCYWSSDIVFLMVDGKWARILVRFLSCWLALVFILLKIMSRLISCVRWDTMLWIDFSFMCSLTEGWILLYIFPRGENWMVGIAFPMWAIMTCVRLCPSSGLLSILFSRKLNVQWFQSDHSCHSWGCLFSPICRLCC